MLRTVIRLHSTAPRTAKFTRTRLAPIAANIWDAETVPDGAIDATFVFDYLTETDPALQLLWDGLLLAAWHGGRMSRAELLSLVRGAGACLQQQANAQVFEAVTLVVEKGAAGFEAASALVARRDRTLLVARRANQP